MQCQTGLSAPSPFLGGLHREEQKYAGHAHIVHQSPDIQDMGVDDGIKYIGQDDFLQDVFQPMLQKALVYQIGPDKPGSPQYFQSKGQGMWPVRRYRMKHTRLQRIRSPAREP